MTKKLIGGNLLFGFLSWLVPFAVSFFFYKPTGELIVPYATFKTLITAVGIISGCTFLFIYFRAVDSDFIANGFIVGFTWFAINILLDALILIPMMKTGFADYFMSVGLAYLSIPAISVTIGYLLNRKVNNMEYFI